MAASATMDRSRRMTNVTDAVLSTLCLAGIAVVGVMILQEPDYGHGDGAAPIATLAFTNGEVRRRPQRTLVWDLIGVGAKARDRDTIFVPPGTHAVFEFDDGSTLELDQNSLVVLERRESSAGGKEAPKVALVKGNVLTTAGSAGLLIETEAGQAELSAGSRASIDEDADSGTRLDVLEGSAAVKTASGTEQVGSDQGRVIKKGEEMRTLSARKVRLQAPAANARIFVTGSVPSVALSWKNGLEGMQVQVSGERNFSGVVASGDGAAGSFQFEAPGFGAWYWRVVDDAGVPISGRRQLMLISDAPPALSTPNATTVLAAPKEAILFAWGGVPGVTNYRFEMSRKKDFSKIVHSGAARGSQLWIPMDFEEGVYSWRVRSVDQARKGSPWSKPARFRLIREELPDAPELFDVEYELELEED